MCLIIVKGSVESTVEEKLLRKLRNTKSEKKVIIKGLVVVIPVKRCITVQYSSKTK